MNQTTRPNKSVHINRPPAYDFKDGLRIWIDGKVVTTFPCSYYENLAKALIEQMGKKHD